MYQSPIHVECTVNGLGHWGSMVKAPDSWSSVYRLEVDMYLVPTAAGEIAFRKQFSHIFLSPPDWKLGNRLVVDC